jgi:hypothetical protein
MNVSHDNDSSLPLIQIPMLKEANMLLIQPNAMVGWLALLFHIQEVLGSNPGPETSYPDRYFNGFPQSIQANAMIAA